MHALLYGLIGFHLRKFLNHLFMYVGGAQDFFCFSQPRCRIREYSRPPTNTSISDCCEGTGSSYAFNERCHECVGEFNLL